jgi:hypothetical protein
VVGGESICAWTPAYGTVTEAIEPPDLGKALPEFEQALAWVTGWARCVEEHLRNQGTNLTYGESSAGEAEGENPCNVGFRREAFSLFPSISLYSNPPV